MELKYTTIDKINLLGFTEVSAKDIMSNIEKDIRIRIFRNQISGKIIILLRDKKSTEKYVIYYNDDSYDASKLVYYSYTNVYAGVYIVYMHMEKDKEQPMILIDENCSEVKLLKSETIDNTISAFSLKNEAITLVYTKDGDVFKFNYDSDFEICDAYIEFQDLNFTRGFALYELSNENMIKRKSGSNYSCSVITRNEAGHESANYIDDEGNLVGEAADTILFFGDKLKRKAVEALIESLTGAENYIPIAIKHVKNDAGEHYAVVEHNQQEEECVLNLFFKLEHEEDMFEYMRLTAEMEEFKKTKKKMFDNPKGILFNFESN